MKESEIEYQFKYMWIWVKRIEPDPHYPIQLKYFGGTFTALWERNFDSAVSFEADTPEAALQGLKEKLQLIADDVRIANLNKESKVNHENICKSK